MKFENSNLLPARGFHLPAQKDGITYLNRQDSDRFQSLDGAFAVCFCNKNTLASALTDGTAVRDITLPGTLLAEDEITLFRRSFVLSKAARKRDVILRIGGVSHGYCVFINGKAVGSAENGSHPAEFDITSYLCEDENTLCIAVSAKAGENVGVTRSVSLVYQNKVCLYDYEVTTKEDTVSVILYPNRVNNDLRAEVLFDRRTRKTDLHTEAGVKFELPSADLWNAEEPNLYDLVIRIFQGDTETEVHTCRVGLCTAVVTDGLFCVNGHPVVLRGVCYEDLGLSDDAVLRDLRLLKTCNFNALRVRGCTHPAVYAQAAEMGFYIMNDFTADEAERIYKTVKSETAVVLYGTESGVNAGYLKNQRVRKPILCDSDEPDMPTVGDFRHLDALSPETLRTFAEEDAAQPALVTSYSCAYGKSPVALRDLFAAFDESPQLQGGFVAALRSADGDGCCFADGTPTPAMAELKALMSPLKIAYENGQFTVHSREVFIRLDHCTMIWNLCEDTKPLNQGMETGLDFGPGETVHIPCPGKLPKDLIPGAVYRVNVMFFCGERDLGYAQAVIATPDPSVPADGETILHSTKANEPILIPVDDAAEVRWYGMGWQENHPDFCASTLVGSHKAQTAEITVSENAKASDGVRSSVRYVILKDKDGKGTLVCGYPDCFSFSLRRQDEKTVLCIVFDDDSAYSIAPFVSEDDALRRIRW